MKVAKSISIDEDLWFEIRQESKKSNITISEYIIQKITSVSTGENESVSEPSLLLNNKYLILNNNLLNLEATLTRSLNEKIKQKAKELQDLKQKQQENQQKLLQDYENALEHAKMDKLDLNEIEALNFEDGSKVSEWWFNKHRGKCKVFSLTDLRIIKNHQKAQKTPQK